MEVILGRYQMKRAMINQLQLKKAVAKDIRLDLQETSLTVKINETENQKISS